METSLKTGFAQIFSCCPKNLSYSKFGGAAAPPRPPRPVRLWRLNRDQVMTRETLLKIHTNVCNFVTASPKIIETLNFFYDFCDIPENGQT